LYIEKLTLKEIAQFYRKYSVFDIHEIAKLNFNALKGKLWRGLTSWNKGPVFKLKWIILFIKVWIKDIFKKGHVER